MSNLFSIGLVLVVVIVIFVLIKGLKNLIENSNIPKFFKSHTKTAISTVAVVLVLLVVVFGIEVREIEKGYHHSFGQIEFSGFTGLHLDKKEYRIDQSVPISFSFGHDKIRIYEEDEEVIIGHTVSVFVEELGNDPDRHTLYSEDYDGVEFYSDENLCECSGLQYIVLKNRYKQNHEVTFAFEDLSFTEGRLIVDITEYFNMQDNIDGSIVSTETEEHRYTYFYFKIENGKVRFSESRL